MWDIGYILKPVSEKTGLTPEEICRTPWSELEERLGIRAVGLIPYYEPHSVLTKERFKEDETECLRFLDSFHQERNMKIKRLKA